LQSAPPAVRLNSSSGSNAGGPSALSGSGAPLPPATRQALEGSFKVSLASVRVHTDRGAQEAATNLSARAFTYGNDIFLGPRERATDLSLMAHEVAHTVQQQGASTVQRSAPGQSDSYEHEAHQSSVAVLQGAPFTVHQRTSGLCVQGERSLWDRATSAVGGAAKAVGGGLDFIAEQAKQLGIGKALDYIAEKANLIPGFRMFTVVLGVNPINMSKVDRSAANILRGLIEVIPGGTLISQALQNHGVFDKVGNWVEQQIKTLGMVGSDIKQALTTFIGGLKLEDITNFSGVWERAKRIFTEPIDRIITFAKGLITDILKFIKDAILRPLAKMAEGTEGWNLLKAVLEQDPITGEHFPRTAETVIGPFMKLIGQEEVWENIKRGKAIDRAWAWFQGALAGLMGFVRAIPKKIVDTISSLTIGDVVTVVGAFGKIAGAFINIATEFGSWALKQVLSLLEILVDVLAPKVKPYIAKAKTAFDTIVKDPVTFVGHLVRAGKLGFEMFASNILEHLKTALIKWITGPLGDEGVYVPKSFSLLEIIKLVLSVLGLTWQNIRAKLVKIIPDPVLSGLEKTAKILVTLVKDGPAAAWEEIKTELTELKDQLISQVIQMVTTEIVKAAVVKLVTSLNPAGAVIQAILAIWNTVTFFIEKIQQIAAVVASFIDSISAIAAGQIDAAAKKVEQTLANTLVLVIGFLAKLVGAGDVPKKVVAIIRKIRDPIDKGLNKIVDWLGKMLQKLVGAAKAGAKALFQWWKKKVPFSGGGESHTILFQGEGESAELMVRTTPKKPEEFIFDYVPAGGSKAEMDQIKSLSTKIEKLKKSIATAQKKDAPNQAVIAKLDADLTVNFNALGQVLAGLLDKAEDEGSEKRPVPIDYPKRRAAAYPNIYIGPLTALFLEQKWLMAAAAAGNAQKAKDMLVAREPNLSKEDDFKAWSGVVKVFKAAGGAEQQLPVGGPVGLDPAFASLSPGKLLLYDEKGSTGGGSKINNKFRPFGFRPGKEGLDGDHVVERQLGGPDTLSNLWPLQAGENRSSGSTVKSLKVPFGKAKAVTVHEARQKKKKAIHLLIKSVK